MPTTKDLPGFGRLPDDVTAEALIRATLDALPSAPALLATARFRYDAGTNFGPAMAPGPVVVRLETGVMTYQSKTPVMVTRAANVGTSAPEIPPLNADFTLGPGDQLLVPANTMHSARNDSGGSASVVGVSLFPPSGPPPLNLPPGMSFEPLVLGNAEALIRGHVHSLPTRPAAMTLDRVTFARGSCLHTHAHQNPEALFVELGSLTVTVRNGDVQASRAAAGGPFGPPEAVPPRSDVVLGPGDGLLIQVGAVTTSCNADAGTTRVLLGAVLSRTHL
jgi:quercetin dioxygenase-like cupin family protein